VSQYKKIRVALVGAGYVSVHHLKALKNLDFVEVVAIADTDLSRAQAVAARFRVPKTFRMLSEMASVAPNVVHILTPPGSHASLAIEALHMGCDVFVEKPMAETTADCDRMISAAEASGRVLSVNHSARMDPVVLKALDVVGTGVCGKITGVDFFRSSDYPAYSGGPELPAPYRKGSYPLQDLGVHGLSICESFLGPVRHTQTSYSSSGSDVNLLFDEWRTMAYCERGTGQMYLSWNVRPIRSEAIVHGTRGVLHLDFFLQTISLVRTLPGPKFVGSVVCAVSNSLKTLWHLPLNVLRFATGRLSGAPGIHISIQKFYEALRQKSRVPIPASEGRRIIRAIEPICRNADEDRIEHRHRQLRILTPAPVLVTGAAGFLGRVLVRRLLSNGDTVRVLVRRSVPQWEDNSRIQMVCGDLGDPELVDHAINGVGTVFHLGAAMKGNPADFERGTIWGTRNVIESSLRHHVKRMVYVSSLSVLDHAGHDPRVPVRESAPYEPHPEWRGLYTQTKLQAELFVLDGVRDRQLPAVILRPGQIFGPDAETSAPSGAISVAGRWVVVGRGNARLPLVFVEDVADALLIASQKPGITGSIFNIVDTENVTQREYIAACRLIGTAKSSLYVPYAVMFACGWACEMLAKALGRSLPLSRYRVRSIRPLAPFDFTNAVEVLGWKPSVGTRNGLKLMSSREKQRDTRVPVAVSPSGVSGPQSETQRDSDLEALVGPRAPNGREGRFQVLKCELHN
jgi:predicted dehydrogenase/nucleoside-diphosphate-sugar epimerase